MISTEQKAIIRSICKEQSKSLIRVMERRCEKIKNELHDEGYDVSFSDIAEQVAKELMLWDRVKENPEDFINLLDEQNISVIKHHLVQDYLGLPHSKPLWRKINLRDEVFTRKN